MFVVGAGVLEWLTDRSAGCRVIGHGGQQAETLPPAPAVQAVGFPGQSVGDGAPSGRGSGIFYDVDGFWAPRARAAEPFCVLRAWSTGHKTIECREEGISAEPRIN